MTKCSTLRSPSFGCIKHPKRKPKKRNSKPAKPKIRRSKATKGDLLLEALKSISCNIKEKPQLRIEPLKDSTQNVTSWFKIYELHTKTWSNKERGIEIGKYFEGLALQKYQLLTDDNNDYEKIKKHMIKLLQPSNNLFNIKASFYSAKQQPEENVEKFGLRLLKYVNDGPNDEREKMLKDLPSVFKRGCAFEIQKVLLASELSNFNEFWESAKEIERCIQSSEISSLMAIDNNNKRVMKCYKCGLQGHFAKHCFRFRLSFLQTSE